MSRGPVELPDLGAQIADTHAHLDMLDDPAGVLERAAIAGVASVATVVDATEAARGTFDALDGWLADTSARLDEWGMSDLSPPEVRIIIGVHPHNAKDYDAVAEKLMRGLASDPRVAAIGECGLDYHYDHSPRDVQREVFRRQLAIAREMDLPVVVHLREAHDDGRLILEESGVPEAGCVIHCFTGDVQELEAFLGMGCMISFAGPVTFKNAETIRTAAASVPLDRLLVETDCPFMAPEPHRGHTNEPAWTVYTAARIADGRDESTRDVAEAVMRNAQKVFGFGKA